MAQYATTQQSTTPTVFSPRAYVDIPASDFGLAAPAAPTIAAQTSGGTLTAGTAHVKITFVTAIGETAASAESTDTIVGTGNDDSVLVTSPTTPNTGAQALAVPVTGYNVYSASSASVLKTNTTPIPIGTDYTITAYGAGVAAPSTNTSGRQPAPPTITAGSTGTLVLLVPQSFKPGLKPAMRGQTDQILVSHLDGSTETTGISQISAVVTGPASGGYSGGGRPRVTITYANTGSTGQVKARDYSLVLP